MSQIPRKHTLRNPSATLFTLFGAFLAIAVLAPAAFAAVPAVVVDSQVAQLTGLNQPQSIAMAPNNSYYVADAANNRIRAYIDGAASTVGTGSYSLVNPEAVAVDSLGDLFIGDAPTSGVGRILEVVAANGVLTSTVKLIAQGAPLQEITALTVDTNPSSSTFNTLYIGDDISSAIYTVAAGSTTVVRLNLSGLPSNVVPTALLKDPAGNLFICDFLSTLYRVPGGSTSASPYFINGFTVWGPSGLALDPAGNLYVLTLTSQSHTPSQYTPLNVLELPKEDPTSAFRIPFTGIYNASGIAFDSLGNLYIADFTGNRVVQVIYGSPIGLAAAAIASPGPAVTFNYELNAPEKLSSFRFYTTGDKSAEIVDQGGGCTAGNYTTGLNGNPISPSDPFICQESFSAMPNYPGLRYGSVNLVGANSAILASTLTYSTGVAAASVVYPLSARAGADTIPTPDAIAISGLDKRIYVSDGSKARVLYTNGPNGTSFTQVNTGSITLGLPYGLALNGAGDLYIADFRLAEIVVVPANPAIPPYAFNPGNLLQHPLSIAFDTSGNLFIGDSGPNGAGADETTPGYLVEVPVGGGAPFKITPGGGVKIVYPQGLATDPYTGALYVADGGPPLPNSPGQVVRIPANGGAASVVTPPGVTNPVAIAFDAAEDYYVLDQTANTLTEVPAGGGTPYTVPIYSTSAATSISTPLGMAFSPGSQNLTVVNAGQTQTANGALVYLRGNVAATLDFGSVAKGQTSAAMQVTLNNIGNIPLTLGDPALSLTGAKTQFPNTENTCSNGLALNPGVTCMLDYQFAPTTNGKLSVIGTFNTTNSYSTGVTTNVFRLEGIGKPR